MKKYLFMFFMFLSNCLLAETLLFEDFESGMIPENWLLIDQDGNTPPFELIHFDDAWIVQENSDAVVGGYNIQSNSRYIPPGYSMDWFITSGVQLVENKKHVLSWDAKFQSNLGVFRNYRVHISNSGQSILDCSRRIQVQSITNENTEYFNHYNVEINKEPLEGDEFINICFYNNSYDSAILMIDNIKLSTLDNDLVLSNPKRVSEYSIFPSHYSGSFQVDVTNNGINPQSNFIITANIYGKSETTPSLTSTYVYSNTLESDQADTVSWVIPSFSDIGLQEGVVYDKMIYTVELADSIDQIPENNSISTPDAKFEISSSDISRYIYTEFTYSPNVVHNHVARYGVMFEFNTPVNIKNTSFVYDNKDCQLIGGENLCAFTDQQLLVEVYSIDESLLTPDLYLGRSELHNVPPNDQIFNIEATTLFSPALNLNAGKYLFSVVQPLRNPAYPSDPTTRGAIYIHGSPINFTENSNWLNWPESPLGDWVSLEYFGEEYERNYNIKVNFDIVDNIFKDGFE